MVDGEGGGLRANVSHGFGSGHRRRHEPSTKGWMMGKKRRRTGD